MQMIMEINIMQINDHYMQMNDLIDQWFHENL